MYCAKCGCNIKEDAVFCPVCGAKQPKKENPPAVQELVREEQNKGPGKKLILIITGSILLLLITGAAICFFVQDPMDLFGKNKVINVMEEASGYTEDLKEEMETLLPAESPETSAASTVAQDEEYNLEILVGEWHWQTEDYAAELIISAPAQEITTDLRVETLYVVDFKSGKTIATLTGYRPVEIGHNSFTFTYEDNKGGNGIITVLYDPNYDCIQLSGQGSGADLIGLAQQMPFIEGKLVMPDVSEEELYHRQLDEFIFEGRTRNYSYDELKDLSEWELHIVRNGMFALSGKIFSSSQWCMEYFPTRSWYKPVASDVRDQMNDYQKDNANLIAEIEEKRGYR